MSGIQWKWFQTPELVIVALSLPEGVVAEDLDVEMQEYYLLVGVRGQEEPLIEGALFSSISSSESKWAVRGAAMHMQLFKSAKGRWDGLFAPEIPEADSEEEEGADVATSSIHSSPAASNNSSPVAADSTPSPWGGVPPAAPARTATYKAGIDTISTLRSRHTARGSPAGPRRRGLGDVFGGGAARSDSSSRSPSPDGSGSEREGGYSDDDGVNGEEEHGLAPSTLRARATSDFIGVEDSDLSFGKGDLIINVVIDNESGWWQGVSNGRSGIFPCLFVELLDDEPDPMSPTSSSGRRDGEEVSLETANRSKEAKSAIENMFKTGGGAGQSARERLEARRAARKAAAASTDSMSSASSVESTGGSSPKDGGEEGKSGKKKKRSAASRLVGFVKRVGRSRSASTADVSEAAAPAPVAAAGTAAPPPPPPLPGTAPAKKPESKLPAPRLDEPQALKRVDSIGSSTSSSRPPPREPVKAKFVGGARGSIPLEDIEKHGTTSHTPRGTERLAELAASRPAAIALYNYKAQDANELNLAEGETVFVITQNADGWWIGAAGGQIGLFPSNYVHIPDGAKEAPQGRINATLRALSPPKASEPRRIGAPNFFNPPPAKRSLASPSSSEPASKSPSASSLAPPAEPAAPNSGTSSMKSSAKSLPRVVGTPAEAAAMATSPCGSSKSLANAASTSRLGEEFKRTFVSKLQSQMLAAKGGVPPVPGSETGPSSVTSSPVVSRSASVSSMNAAGKPPTPPTKSLGGSPSTSSMTAAGRLATSPSVTSMGSHGSSPLARSVGASPRSAAPAGPAYKWFQDNSSLRIVFTVPSGTTKDQLKIQVTNTAVDIRGPSGATVVKGTFFLSVHGSSASTELSKSGTRHSATVTVTKAIKGKWSVLLKTTKEGAKEGGKTLLTAVAIRDFAPSGTDELAFAEGDTITITEQDEKSGFWYGSSDGLSGWLPMNYVTVVEGTTVEGAKGGAGSESNSSDVKDAKDAIAAKYAAIRAGVPQERRRFRKPAPEPVQVPSGGGATAKAVKPSPSPVAAAGLASGGSTSPGKLPDGSKVFDTPSKAMITFPLPPGVSGMDDVSVNWTGNSLSVGPKAGGRSWLSGTTWGPIKPSECKVTVKPIGGGHSATVHMTKDSKGKWPQPLRPESAAEQERVVSAPPPIPPPMMASTGRGAVVSPSAASTRATGRRATVETVNVAVDVSSSKTRGGFKSPAKSSTTTTPVKSPIKSPIKSPVKSPVVKTPVKTPKTPVSGGPPLVRVLWDFKGEPGSDELTVSKGTVMKLMSKDDDGWWEVESQDATQRGIVPSNYVKLVPNNPAPASGSGGMTKSSSGVSTGKVWKRPVVKPDDDASGMSEFQKKLAAMGRRPV